jgi:uncharacterized protein YecE (DUF72 family)
MRVQSGIVRVGCSGWDYPDWRDRFYGRDCPRSTWLEAYTQHFDTVELNNSFYRLPTLGQFAGWRSRVPKGFLFAVKASRYLTHFKRLLEPAEPVARLFDRARALGSALGPVLYQLPPRWLPDQGRLQTFLRVLPRRIPANGRPHRAVRHVLELRDPRGYEPEVMTALERHAVAVCLHDMRDFTSPRIAQPPFLYIRFHGYGARYAGAYPDEVLRDWAHWVGGHARAGLDAFVYFNNDTAAQAPRDALRFRELL